MKNFIKNTYTYDPQSNIFYRDNGESFFYSDGEETERDIADALKTVSDKSLFSSEVRSLQRDWPTTYHFSSRRTNLLRPFERCFEPGKRVLELGCGCGALTRYIAECGAEVLAVDGSCRRASIAALRCSDLGNATFLADTIQNLPEGLGTFDVVTLVGVLEYARLYGNGSGAELGLLRKARSFLKGNGILLLAIENKLGLKYFAGIPEDHINVSWGSITNLYSNNSVATYSRNELVRLLLNAGFSAYEQFIPVPDYKLPVSIIMPSGIHDTSEDMNLAAILGHSDRSFEYPPIFNIESAYKSVVDAGLLHELANSLCFIAYASEHEHTDVYDNDILVEHYGDIKGYEKKLVFRKRDNEIQVFNEQLVERNMEGHKRVCQILEKRVPYYRGELLVDRIRKVVVKPGWTCDKLAEAFSIWFDLVDRNLLPDSNNLPQNFLDLIPINIIIDDRENPVIIDQEWVACEPVPSDTVIIRGIVVTLQKIGVAAEPAPGTDITFENLLKKICS